MVSISRFFFIFLAPYGEDDNISGAKVKEKGGQPGSRIKTRTVAPPGDPESRSAEPPVFQFSSHDPERRAALRRRNKRLILATLAVLVVVVYAILIVQRTRKRAVEDEPFPPEKWTIEAPESEDWKSNR